MDVHDEYRLVSFKCEAAFNAFIYVILDYFSSNGYSDPIKNVLEELKNNDLFDNTDTNDLSE